VLSQLESALEQPDVEAVPVVPGHAQLSQAQQARLAELETRIAAGLSAFLDVAEALWAIKTERLFRGAHQNFDSYCQEKWHFRGHHGRRLLRAFDVARSLQGNGDCPPLPPDIPEKLLRPLTPLLPALRVSIWRLANQITDGSPESLVVERLVKAVKTAINHGTGERNGTGRRPDPPASRASRASTPHFFAGVSQLVSGRAGFSAYLIVGQIDAKTARTHLVDCQHAISMLHEVVGQLRTRFPEL
jgi:hypothetical protein